MKKYVTAVFIFFLFVSYTLAQTAGKLAGRVTDESGSPLSGANVIIDGTKLGAAADNDGYYTILNVRAGIYTVKFRYIGYQSKLIQNVKLSPDQTTKLNVQLSDQFIQGQEVTVIAERPLVEFNQTSSIASVTKDEIAKLPVQGLDEIVNLQAGVVDGHFRGGRIGEVQYQVDGVTVNNPFDNSSSLSLDRSVIQEVQVISGTFDAKYGQAMSGVVNAVLKTGSEKFEWSGEIYGGDHYTTDSKRYPENKDYNPLSVQNYQFTLSGPTGLPATTFFVSGRRYYNDGYLYGYRRFNPTDKSNFETRQFNPTGDNKRVSMNTNSVWSGQFKVTNQSLQNIQVSYQASYEYAKRKAYDNAYRFNPDGTKTNSTISLMHGFQFIHTLSDKFFYKVDFRNNYFDYSDYMYEDLYNPLYLMAGKPVGDANYEDGAIIQGVDLGRYKQKTNSYIIKSDITWQINRFNLLETGFEGQLSHISFGSPGVLVSTNVDGQEILQPREVFPDEPGIQNYWPQQFAAYLQDRVEIGDLVIRAGVRAEYYDPHAKVPSDLQNPANAISGAPLSYLKNTTPKYTLAPRLGFSFPLTSMSSVYFSYGHFYQMPGLNLLYSNADYNILRNLQAGASNYGVMGNPDLNPERTVQYEFGLKQALTNSLGLELSFFYKDIRDLLGAEFVSTYAAAEYGRFTNIDFGSVSGFTISIAQRSMGALSTSLDYTMQFAQGNSSDPRENANRASAGKDSRPRDIPFSWDQRHTLNATAVYFVPDNFSVSTIIKFGSGQPYTPEIGTGFGADLESNSGRKKSYVLIDFRAEKYFMIGPVNMSLFLRAFNLLNTNFVNGFVFAGTGSPDYSLYSTTDRTQLGNPSRFQEPRRIEIGISFRSL